MHTTTISYRSLSEALDQDGYCVVPQALDEKWIARLRRGFENAPVQASGTQHVEHHAILIAGTDAKAPNRPRRRSESCADRPVDACRVSVYCGTQARVNGSIGPRNDPRPLRPNRINVLELFTGRVAMFLQYEAQTGCGYEIYSSTFET